MDGIQWYREMGADVLAAAASLAIVSAYYAVMSAYGAWPITWVS